MNSELIVKDVEFHGDMLRAAQDPDGKVWVGVRWMCKGMGFDNERMKNERKKIQRDIVLFKGVKFYPLEKIVQIQMFYVLILIMFHCGLLKLPLHRQCREKILY